jgi:hypothetical protein
MEAVAPLHRMKLKETKKVVLPIIVFLILEENLVSNMADEIVKVKVKSQR